MNERPTSITVVCVLMGIGAVLSLPIIFMASSLLPSWYTPFALISTAVGVACMIGLWAMKKWSVFLYTGMFALGQAIAVATGTWKPLSLILPAIIIIIMFSNIDRMS